MKLLLDEQVPARLAREFPENIDVVTVQKMGWASAKNGALLQLAANDGFTALLSADKNMQYQQSTNCLLIPVVVLAPRMNRLADLIALVPAVLRLLDQNPLPGFYRIDV
jgi:predicted nuclease of predicted toxin-antitoxin system